MMRSLLLAAGLTLTGCGGAPPAAEVPPEPPPGAPPAETHTMPDGTTMPGSHHGEGVAPTGAPSVPPPPPKSR